jgi:phosphate-selective porin OprO and OprP
MRPSSTGAGRPSRMHHLARRRSWLVSATVFLGLAGATAVRSAEPSAQAADAQALRAQVDRLTALVETLSHHDEELSAQVKALQAKLAAREAAEQAPTETAIPRAAQAAPPETGAAQAAQTPPPPPSIIAPSRKEAAADDDVATPQIVQTSSHGFQVQSADGAYSIGLFGTIQIDAGDYLDVRPDSPYLGPQTLSNGVNARRAQIGVAGRVARDWAYALLYDGGGSSDQTPTGLRTAQIMWTGPRGTAWEFGYSNTYFTLDQSTSSVDLLFLERASPSNIATKFNTGNARANAGARFFSKWYWLGGYITGPQIGDSHSQTGERFGAFERATVQVVTGRDYSVHLGADLDQLFRAPNSGNTTPDTLTLSDRPELRIDPTNFLNTGAIGTAINPVTGGAVYDVETAATWRSVFWQGEYYHYTVSRLGLSQSAFNGGYGELSWVFTGEAHRYNAQGGNYRRPLPKDPFSIKNGGWGAWEIAARFSYIDLDNNYLVGDLQSATPAAVIGGKQYGYTFGLNWYPNDLIRLMFDYNHIDFQKFNAENNAHVPLGAPIGTSFDAISLRALVAY